MIEGLDRNRKTFEQEAGEALLKAVRDNAPLSELRHLGKLYDAMPMHDVQVRDAFDDALLCAGWERVA